MQKSFSHVGPSGNIKMVDIGGKKPTRRMAIARGEIQMATETIEMIRSNRIMKGNVLETARLAGIMAAKRTDQLIPLCHPLNITCIDISFKIESCCVIVEAEVQIDERTGVEMEAFTAVSVSLLTVYDMCKSVDRGMMISSVYLLEKQGGKSGLYKRSEEKN